MIVISVTLEILKTGKLALWCIGVGSKAAKKRTRENDSESEASDMEETSKGNASRSKKKKTASEERESRVVELKKQLRENMVQLTLVFNSVFGLKR